MSRKKDNLKFNKLKFKIIQNSYNFEQKIIKNYINQYLIALKNKNFEIQNIKIFLYSLYKYIL